MLVYAPRGRVTLPVITPYHEEMAPQGLMLTNSPTTNGWQGAPIACFYPLLLPEPFVVSKAFWVNGATLAPSQAIDIGIYAMTDMTTGRCDLLRSTGPVCSAVYVNAAQEAGWNQAIVRNVMSNNSSTDATSYTTGIVALSAGKMYILSVENSHGTSATAVSSIDNGPTFTSRSTTQFNTNLNRVSIWTAVPATNYTGTLVINFGATTQTGAVWSLEEVSGVDTATTDGMVQQAVATGNSVTPSVTLAAFGSIYNTTYFACSNVADTTTTPKANFAELVDISAATPLQTLETQWSPFNDTAPNGTITSGEWGACGIEIKAATAPSSPWRIARANITASFSDSDATSYTTASVTMKAGRLYLMAVENTKASAADAVTSITGGGTWTSRSTTTFDTSTAKRISIWSCVPSADYTGTIAISFGANTETSCIWSLNEFSGVDTTTNDGIVQNATNTGNSANPNVSLSAFGSSANSTFQCAASVSSSAHNVVAGMTQLSTTASATPAARMSAEVRHDDVRNPATTVTSSQWGACAVEIKCDTTTPFVIPASLPGSPNIYMGLASNSLVSFLASTANPANMRAKGVLEFSSAVLPSSCTAIAVSGTRSIPLAGFSSRSLIG